MTDAPAYYMGEKLDLPVEFFPAGYEEPAFLYSRGDLKQGTEFPLVESIKVVVALPDGPPVTLILAGETQEYRKQILMTFGLVLSQRNLRVASAKGEATEANPPQIEGPAP